MIRVGIFFGGNSREREVSFAGGRTVYDNLQKSIFEPVPIFVDSFNNLYLLEWEWIYKGSIRDFYPNPLVVPELKNGYQVYAESVIHEFTADELIKHAGKKLSMDELKTIIDIAFLALHGENGEDGRLQGMLEWIGLPYTGSGIMASSIGMNKAVQKKILTQTGCTSAKYTTLQKSDYEKRNIDSIVAEIKQTVGFPCVVKPANQGSSIGVTVLKEESTAELIKAIRIAFFEFEITSTEWLPLSEYQKVERIKHITDIRSGLGLPLRLVVDGKDEKLYYPDVLQKALDESLIAHPLVTLKAIHSETEVIIEEFLVGREFSCIVIEDENGKPLALPPTEIVKTGNLYDYRSKYLPGFSRKLTPIDTSNEVLAKIASDCIQLYSLLGFSVYARIDGFLCKDGRIILNDPNTTSGMMPSSFFFHQAAEIGLDPGSFITYIIQRSLVNRSIHAATFPKVKEILNGLNQRIDELNNSNNSKKRVAVILGGYSSERHISVESGRNVYEKLSSSSKYEPTPIFLRKNEKGDLELFKLPISLLLKDNADDISEKISNFYVHPYVEQVQHAAQSITKTFSSRSISTPEKVEITDLKAMFDGVFIALHGRPGEDGTLQKMLDSIGLPYNGSSPSSSEITINKFRTNEILRNHGILVANHCIISKEEFEKNTETLLDSVFESLGKVIIAIPVDDGCSSAVKKIKTKSELKAYCEIAFRSEIAIPLAQASVLNLHPSEEFPMKNEVLVESFIQKNDATHFLEVTGGLLTSFNDHGEVVYEMFEASESLAESEILSLEEKFLAGQGQNITPARYASDPAERNRISKIVKSELEKAARILNVTGYCRIDAFVKIYANGKVDVYIIEVNSLPGMTPATCIFHQTAIQGYKPLEFIDRILDFGHKRLQRNGF